MNRPLRRRHTSPGFTLIELLIALSVFAVLAVMAYGGLRTVLTARAQTAAQAERLAGLQSAFLLIGRDLVQLLDRPVRSAMGDELPAIVGGERADPLLELTRGGWRNPVGQPRSDLQRVGWRVIEQQLIRENWQVLDRAQDSAPYRAVLLDGVKGMAIRFLDTEGNWLEAWPPQLRNAAGPVLPRAVEVTLQLGDLGPVARLYPVPDNVFQTAAAPSGGSQGQGSTPAGGSSSGSGSSGSGVKSGAP